MSTRSRVSLAIDPIIEAAEEYVHVHRMYMNAAIDGSGTWAEHDSAVTVMRQRYQETADRAMAKVRRAVPFFVP